MRSVKALARFGCAALLALTWAAHAAEQAGAAAPSSDPAQVVRNVSENLLNELAANRPQYRDNPQKLRQLVDKQVLPYFDIEYASRLVLGRHWRDATPDQRQRFIQAFESSLLQNYGNALVEFNSNRLKVLPDRPDPSAMSAIVRTQVARDDGSVTAVNYVLHQTPQGWKAWDVIIEGISYVKSFRDDFGEQIDQQGIDAVIARLQKGASPNVPGAQHHPSSASS